MNDGINPADAIVLSFAFMVLMVLGTYIWEVVEKKLERRR